MSNTTQQTSSKRNTRLRRALLATIATVGIAGGVGLASGSASAAGPYTLVPHQIGIFPTWVFSGTNVCVANTSATTYAKVRVTPVSRPDLYDDIYAGPRQVSCINRWWGGAPIIANNLGTTVVSVATS
jgi:hypothetical protein